MVAAHASNLVSPSVDLDPGDLQKRSSRQSVAWLTRPSRLHSDSPSSDPHFDHRTLDGSLGRDLLVNLRQAQAFQTALGTKSPALPVQMKAAPPVDILTQHVPVIASEKPSLLEVPKDPIRLTTKSDRRDPSVNDSDDWDDVTLNSFHTCDAAGSSRSLSANRPGNRLSRSESSNKTTMPSPQKKVPSKKSSLGSVKSTSLQQWVKQFLAPRSKTEDLDANLTARPPRRSRSTLQSEKGPSASILGNVSPVDEPPFSISRHDMQVKTDNSLPNTIQEIENVLKEAIEVAERAAGESPSQLDDSRAENSNLKPLFLSPQSPVSNFRKTHRRSTKEYHDALYGHDDLSRLAVPLRTATRAGILAVTASPKSLTPTFITRPRLSENPSHMGSNDGADTGTAWNRYDAASRLERQGAHRSDSSESNIPMPLRMEDERTASFSYSLGPEMLGRPSQEETSRPPIPLAEWVQEEARSPTETEHSAGPKLEAAPTSTDQARPILAKTSGIDLIDRQDAEQRKLASRLLLRRHCLEKFELGRNHPATRVLTGSFAQPDLLKDATVPDADGIVWADGPQASSLGQAAPTKAQPGATGHVPEEPHEMHDLEATDKVPDKRIERPLRPSYTLRHKRHFSLEPHRPFNLSKAHKRAPIARDWSVGRKRFVAAIACISTALMGIVIGIYAGEVPAIQYAIVDQSHYTILGNVVFFLGLAIPTFFLYPLPLLHGRKPYTLAALAVLLPLHFPPAVIVSQQRDPGVKMYRVGLLLSRALAGVAMGFANFNFFSTLLDLFGSSLMSSNPHQEAVVDYDPRRHGGGMGVWLGIWTWCFLGSIGLGFFIGALIVSGLNVAWGFWIIIVLTVVVLMLNVVAPEVRRSAYRKSMAEVRKGNEVSRRVARGEIMMHLYSTGPLHWWEEVFAGIMLNGRMLKQPSFLIMAVYIGWMYAQVVLEVVLLGALTSRYYRFYPQTVGLCVAAVPLGAMFAIPFQKAGIFSRARNHPPRTDSMTFQRRVTWTSHLIRRGLFTISLPFAGMAYTLSSAGPPTPAAVPAVFAGLVGFLSALALSECVGLIMETFDVSDLQPGMTGRRRSVVPEADLRRRANYSCYPRVVSGMACAQGFAFLLAAGATAWGGNVERAVGAQTATGIVASILLGLSLALIAVLTRFKTVQVVPKNRLNSVALRGPGEDLPVIIGHPSGFNRRVSWLELGKWTRWHEIRARNKLL